MEANNNNYNNGERYGNSSRLNVASTPPNSIPIPRNLRSCSQRGSPILMSPLGNFIPASELNAEPGDLIEINRTIYCHWALYYGDGKAIHITGQNSEISQENAECRIDDLVDIAGGSLVRVNNREVPAKERGLVAQPVGQILTRACEKIGENVEYNLLTRNCEHYVTEWRYGMGWSDQASIALGVMSMFSQFNNKKPQTTNGSTSAHNAMMSGIEALLQQSIHQGNRSPSNSSSDSLLR